MVMFNLIQGSGRGRDLDCPLIVSRSLLRATATVPQLQLQLQWDSLLRDPTVDFAPLCTALLAGALGTSRDTNTNTDTNTETNAATNVSYKCIYKFWCAPLGGALRPICGQIIQLS